eukprot:PLAT13792.1.p1 GENE.PLAT13792.1~~PLAT13792.1.p1  ORF type:complete len:159 (-),score=30.00 PLAT13792.1:82-558(-)
MDAHSAQSAFHGVVTMVIVMAVLVLSCCGIMVFCWLRKARMHSAMAARAGGLSMTATEPTSRTARIMKAAGDRARAAPYSAGGTTHAAVVRMGHGAAPAAAPAAVPMAAPVVVEVEPVVPMEPVITYDPSVVSSSAAPARSAKREPQNDLPPAYDAGL